MSVNPIDLFGQHAGTIWQILQTSGPLSEPKIMEITGINTEDFYTAVGWLARENKIIKSGSLYILGETNLTPKIGRDAGKIWQVLDIWGDVNLLSIKLLARIDEEAIFSALGWLAREGKIEITQTNSEKASLHVWLK